MKRFLPILLGVFLFLGVQQVKAATLTLTSIGSSDTTGQTFTSWTYTDINPLFTGTATPSSTVTITIAGAPSSTTSGETGVWTYQPTTITEEGSYQIAITSGSENIQFILTIDDGVATTTTKGATEAGGVELPETLPQSGSNDAFLFLGGGLLMLVAGFSSRVIFKNGQE